MNEEKNYEKDNQHDQPGDQSELTITPRNYTWQLPRK